MGAAAALAVLLLALGQAQSAVASSCPSGWKAHTSEATGITTCTDELSNIAIRRGKKTTSATTSKPQLKLAGKGAAKVTITALGPGGDPLGTARGSVI